MENASRVHRKQQWGWQATGTGPSRRSATCGAGALNTSWPSTSSRTSGIAARVSIGPVVRALADNERPLRPRAVALRRLRLLASAPSELGSWESISFRIGRGKVIFAPRTVDLCRCRSNLARAQFRATGQRDGGHATTCTPAGAPRVQLPRPEESAPKSCRAATHGKPLSSVGPQRSRFLTLFHHSDRRRQERLHGLDRPSAGAGRPRASMPGTVRRVVQFSSEADRSNGGTLASPLSRPCRARRP